MRRARTTSRAARSHRQRRRVQKHVLALPRSMPYACLQHTLTNGCDEVLPGVLQESTEEESSSEEDSSEEDSDDEREERLARQREKQEARRQVSRPSLQPSYGAWWIFLSSCPPLCKARARFSSINKCRIAPAA